MTDEQKSAQKCISEQLSEVLATLSKDQIRFVVALMDHPNKKEAAESIGIQPGTVYRWNGNIDKAAQLMALDRAEAAKAIRRNAIVKAMAVKLAGLDSDDESIRQKVATELIEWELGKALQRTDVDLDVNKLVIEYVNDWRNQAT